MGPVSIHFVDAHDILFELYVEHLIHSIILKDTRKMSSARNGVLSLARGGASNDDDEAQMKFDTSCIHTQSGSNSLGKI